MVCHFIYLLAMYWLKTGDSINAGVDDEGSGASQTAEAAGDDQQQAPMSSTADLETGSGGLGLGDGGVAAAGTDAGDEVGGEEQGLLRRRNLPGGSTDGNRLAARDACVQTDRLDGVSRDRSEIKVKGRSPVDMKRAVIIKKMDPLAFIASCAADFDVATDWAFVYDLVYRVHHPDTTDPQHPKPQYSDIWPVTIAAIVFSAVGSVMWFLVATEFHPIAALEARWPHRWQLLPPSGGRIPIGVMMFVNMCFEDIPQLTISSIDTDRSGLTLFGAFNIAGSVFAIISRAVEAYVSRKEIPARAELQLMDNAPEVIHDMLDVSDAADEAKELLVWLADYSKDLRRAQLVAEDHKKNLKLMEKVLALPSVAEALQMQRNPFWGVAQMCLRKERKEGLELAIRGTPLRELPEFYGIFTSARSLSVERCMTLQSVPNSIAQLSGLTSLDFHECKALKSVPESIGQLTGLTSLNFSGCKVLRRVPDSIGNFSKITSLDFSGCRALQSVPESIGQLTGLTSLDFTKCGALQSIPETIGQLTGLTRLHFYGCCAIEKIPESLGKLTRIIDPSLFGRNAVTDPTSLSFEGYNALKIVPRFIGQLTGLTSLDFSGCTALQHVPESIGKLTGLTSLDFNGCSVLKSVPEAIGQLTGLTSLTFFMCTALQSVPDSIGNLTLLTSLTFFMCNALEGVPDSIGNLSKITRLDFSGCKALQSVPESIGRLTGLTHLFLVKCQDDVVRAAVEALTLKSPRTLKDSAIERDAYGVRLSLSELPGRAAIEVWVSKDKRALVPL